MGMDITGNDPIIRGKRLPEIDWFTSSEEEKKEYLDIKNKYYADNPGIYFRANIWSWRPIAEIINHANNLLSLNLPKSFIDDIHYNSGAGLKTQEECNQLANAIDSIVNTQFGDWDVIGINYQMYARKVINKDGKMFEENLYNNPELLQKLEDHLQSNLFIKNGEFEYENVKYYTSHGVSKETIQEFITFLRECGGFEIW